MNALGCTPMPFLEALDEARSEVERPEEARWRRQALRHLDDDAVLASLRADAARFGYDDVLAFLAPSAPAAGEQG
jgi:hypothetical protein